MIKTTELMRGNLVADEHGIISYVYQIYSTGVELAENMSGSGDIDAREDEIFPIPITEELLLKFGFEKIRDLTYSIKSVNDNKIGLTALPNGKFNVGVSGIFGLVFTKHINHLHQLQNLFFSLSGEELTIKL